MLLGFFLPIYLFPECAKQFGGPAETTPHSGSLLSTAKTKKRRSASMAADFMRSTGQGSR